MASYSTFRADHARGKGQPEHRTREEHELGTRPKARSRQTDQGQHQPRRIEHRAHPDVNGQYHPVQLPQPIPICTTAVSTCVIKLAHAAPSACMRGIRNQFRPMFKTRPSGRHPVQSPQIATGREQGAEDVGGTDRHETADQQGEDRSGPRRCTRCSAGP